MKTLRPFLIIALMALLPSLVRANALQVSNLTVDQTAGTVTFTLQWSNSWRVSTVPFNWDGAWLFVKFRQCGAAPTVAWTHGLVSTTVADHTIPGTLQAIRSDGSATGIDAAPNNTGILVRQAVDGVYPTAGPYTITMKVNNLPAAGTSIDVKVFGIEMVFVPQGDYTIGDGYNNYGCWASFQMQAVANETFTTVREWCGNNVSTTLHANFPKGYKPFHCMKYEISQGQYAEFLNTINSTAQTARFQNPANPWQTRYTVSNTGVAPNTYVAGREDRACNWIRWNDVSAYLDWAALRPMTELEFEKACRGQAAPVPSEFAWGSTTVVAANTIAAATPIPSPVENGTETAMPTTANIVFYNQTFGGLGDGWRGPLRSGVFALPTTSTRVASGATYYGIMEMSGNVNEAVVSCHFPTYQGELGDGNLDAAGAADPATWPKVEGTNGNTGYGYRGGSWEHGGWESRTSYRYHCYIAPWWNHSGQQTLGGRGAR